MALERRERGGGVLGAVVNTTSAEHEDKFYSLVRINQIRATSPTSALALTLSLHHGGAAFPAGLSTARGEAGAPFLKHRA